MITHKTRRRKSGASATTQQARCASSIGPLSSKQRRKLASKEVAGQIRAEREIQCKPFKKHHAEQLKLVSDFRWIDFEPLSDVEELITRTLSAESAKEYMEDNRIKAIAETVNRRIESLLRLAIEQVPVQSHSIEDDVQENIAEDYVPKMSL